MWTSGVGGVSTVGGGCVVSNGANSCGHACGTSPENAYCTNLRDREAKRGTQRHSYVLGLPAAEDYIAEEHVCQHHCVGGAGRDDGAPDPRGLLGRQFNLPQVRRRGHRGVVLPSKGDGHRHAGVRGAPDRDGLVTLEHHVGAEDVGEADSQIGADRREEEKEGDEEEGAASSHALDFDRDLTNFGEHTRSPL